MPTEERLQEIHRLAVLRAVAEIAQKVGPQLTGHWLRVSRFREVRDVSQQTLSLGPHARTLYDLAWAKQVLGERQEALKLYGEALKMYEAADDRQAQAATLNNLGSLYARLGQPQQALAYYEQALPLREAVGDRAGQATTRYNIAMRYRTQGQLAEAVEQLRQVVELEAQVQHPDLEADTALLRQVEQEWQQSRTQGDTTSGPQQSAEIYAAEAGPAEALQGAKHFLEQGQIGSARAILQDALQRYPAETRLQHLSQVAPPGKVVPRDVRYSDRVMEIAWIKANSSHYHGKWVALFGEQVLAIGDSLKAVLQHVQELQLEDTPFIHHCS